MATPATPVAIIESWLKIDLKRSALKHFAKVSDDRWIDFAKHYLAKMESDFASEFLEPPPASDPSLRLYFEPRLRDSWDTAVRKQGQPTPLLGLSPYPPTPDPLTREQISRLLNPLKKHLLLADSLYIRDSFYSCFDYVADSVDRQHWRDDPNTAQQVRRGVQSIKDWLPILIELRPLIDSRALVFMPYYVTPSFPYDATSPKLKPHFAKLRMRPGRDQYQSTLTPEEQATAIRTFWSNTAGETDQAPSKPSESQVPTSFDESEVLGAWLNARIMHLDPVFPTRNMSDWAGRLYFDDGADTADVTSDLMSVAVLPFGNEREINLDTLMAMRKNERVFDEIKLTVAACKAHIEANLAPTATPVAVTEVCKQFIRDRLDNHEEGSKLKLFDESPGPAIAFALAIGVAFMAATPVVGVIGSACLTPKVFRIVQGKLDPKRRAYGHLQAVL